MAMGIVLFVLCGGVVPVAASIWEDRWGAGGGLCVEALLAGKIPDRSKLGIRDHALL